MLWVNRMRIYHNYFNKSIIMIVRGLLGGLGRFGFAQSVGGSQQINLFKPHLKKYFKNDVTLVDKQAKQIAKKYSLTAKGVEKLFRMKPQVFIADSLQRAQIENKIKFLNNLEEREPFAVLLNQLLFDSKHLLLEMTESDIINFIATIKQFGFDESSAPAIFSNANNLIHSKFDIVYQQKLDILQDYLNLSKEEALKIFIGQPFLLTCSAHRLRESVLYFVQRQTEVLTKEKIVGLLQELGQVFLVGRERLNELIQWYRTWGVGKEELWQILLDNPLLLLNHPSEILHFKVKMFRQFRFTLQMGQAMLRKHPSALICSVRSLESKFLTARDRLKISFNPNNLEFISVKFAANLRPRAEMLVRGKVPYTSEDIADYLTCSEKDFFAKTKVPAEKYYQQRSRFKFTKQLDFPRHKCLRNYPSDNKIFELSKKYYPQEDLALSGEQSAQKQ